MENLFDQIPDVVAKAPRFGYFNTTRLKNPELQECKEKAQSQTEAVLKFFQKYGEYNWNCWEVFKYLKLKNVPITSIRRSITVLTQAGKLVETGNMRVGSYGRKCKCYKLK